MVEDGFADPVMQKTFAQFLLLGDPSLHLTTAQPRGTAMLAADLDQGARRRLKRAELMAKAAAIKRAGAYAELSDEAVPNSVVDKLRAFTRDWRVQPATFARFQFLGGAELLHSLKIKAIEPYIVVGSAGLDDPSGHVIVAWITDGRLTSARAYVKRMNAKRATMTGMVRGGHVFAGSKSDHQGVVLDTKDGSQLVLRRRGAPLGHDVQLNDLIGHTIKGSGVVAGPNFVLHDYKVLD